MGLENNAGGAGWGGDSRRGVAVAAVTVCLGGPRGDEEEAGDGGGDDHGDEDGVPAVAVGDVADPPTGEDARGVSEDSGEADGGGGGAFSREVGGGDTDEALRAVDQEAG